MKQTALLSVYNKEGIVEFGRALSERGWDILASGGTAKALTEAGISVKDVGEIVGDPILGHRVVTLSRQIHAALLARDIPEDTAELARIGIPRIDLVCVDLYPLREAIAKEGASRASVIEMTDVGGPTMLHSAAKGERFVICDPKDRMTFIEWLDAGAPDAEAMRDGLAGKADAYVADYCLSASRYRANGMHDGIVGTRVQECKYGENAWQTPAGLFASDTRDPLALANFTLIAGDAPSYNNLADIDRLLQTITHIAAAFDVNQFGKAAIAAGVKHGNACGAAVGASAEGIIGKMVSGDTRAIFGGVIMTTFEIDGIRAKEILHDHMPEGARRLLDGVVAPSFTEEAIELLARKGGKCRLIANPALSSLSATSLDRTPRMRFVRGGFLLQPNYTFVLDLKDSAVEKDAPISSEIARDILLAWAVGSTSNSNTVTLVCDGQLIGNGVGQQDRVGCCELAIKRARDAGHEIAGAVAYSDSFFPFPDGPKVLADAGVKAIFATSGSVKDAEVRKTCTDAGVVFITLPDARARGFYNH